MDMDKELLLIRIKEMCNKKGVNKTTAYIESGVGKNFGSNLKLSNPSKKNLALLAKYFDCPVDYLIGTADENDISLRATEEVIEWLEDNDFEVQQNDELCEIAIGKDGEWVYFNTNDFARECLAIKSAAQDGFELAMKEWQNKNFEASTYYNEEEQFLIDTFRNLSREGKAQVYQALLNIRDSEQQNAAKASQAG